MNETNTYLSSFLSPDDSRLTIFTGLYLQFHNLTSHERRASIFIIFYHSTKTPENKWKARTFCWQHLQFRLPRLFERFQKGAMAVEVLPLQTVRVRKGCHWPSCSRLVWRVFEEVWQSTVVRQLVAAPTSSFSVLPADLQPSEGPVAIPWQAPRKQPAPTCRLQPLFYAIL